MTAGDEPSALMFIFDDQKISPADSLYFPKRNLALCIIYTPIEVTTLDITFSVTILLNNFFY